MRSSSDINNFPRKDELPLTYMETLALLEFLKLKEAEDPLQLLTPQNLSQQVNVSVPRAYALLKQLESKNLVKKYPRKGFLLTEEGKRVLQVLVHRHRVLETYFVKILQMTLIEACEEATRLALHSSETLIARLCDAVGQPGECPHGKSIPHVLH